LPPERIALHEADLTDGRGMADILRRVAPTRLFHLAAESRVARSFADPAAVLATQPPAAATLIRGIVDARLAGDCRLFLASSSEIFDPDAPGPWDETTPLGPVSPYGAAKAATHLLAKVARDGYGIFAVSGVLFNHESPRRDEGFVSAKIVQAARRLANGNGPPLPLGALDAARDWGWAPQFVEGMIASLDAERPGDYVFATGETRTIRQFATAAFAAAGRGIRWEGTGLGETGVCAATGALLVVVDPALVRPVDRPTRPGDPFRAARRLGWRPTVRFDELVARLVRGEGR
ncbi:MAG: GDP-mannose 4,6-dehydratase, partial [Nitrospinae bacterium]|nr:GDP-mannose 4,6-dehydratase [Nitrospinota bacterium]